MHNYQETPEATTIKTIMARHWPDIDEEFRAKTSPLKSSLTRTQSECYDSRFYSSMSNDVFFEQNRVYNSDEQYGKDDREGDYKWYELKQSATKSPSHMLRDNVDSWSNVTTIHGIADFARAESYLAKFFWAFIIALSFGVCFAQLGSMLYSFQHNPWNSAVREVRAEELHMPHIDLCNYNRLRRSMVKRYSMSSDVERFVYESTPAIYAFNRHYTEEERTVMALNYARWRNTSGLSFEQVFDKMAHSCNDMIVAFGWTNDKISGNDLCAGKSNIAKVSEHYDLHFGRCWRVTMTSQHKIQDSGQSEGVFLMLNAELDEYPAYLHDVFLDQGFRMKVSYDNLDPGSWVSVPAGHHVWVKIKKHSYRTEHHPLEIVPRRCIDRDKIDHSLFISGYWRDDCEHNCIFNQNFVKMNCSHMLPNKALNYPMCEPDFFLEYGRKHGFLERKEDVTPEVYAVCSHSCQEPCNYDMVEAESDIGVIPNPEQSKRASQVLKQFNLNLTEDEVTSYLTLVNVYYDSMLVKECYSYAEYTVDILLANVGGQFGLWTGISVIGLLQALLYAVNAIFARLQQTCCRVGER